MILLIFCMQLFAFCWISIEATKICHFGLALSSIGSHPIRLSNVLKLKKLEIIWGIKLIVCLHWRHKKHHAILAYAAKYSWHISWRNFYFWLVWLVNLNTGGTLLHRTCYFLEAQSVCLPYNLTQNVQIVNVKLKILDLDHLLKESNLMALR